MVIGGVEQKAHFFVLDLPHSDACYVRAYPAATAEAWADGHVHAFGFFGRVPLSVLYDSEEDQESIQWIDSPTNGCLVARILPDGTRKRATLFSGLLSHYVIEDRYGRPGKGNDKGAVEGIVGWSRRNFVVPLPRFATWDGLQRLAGRAVPQAADRDPARPRRDDRRTASARSRGDGAAAGGAVRRPATRRQAE